MRMRIKSLLCSASLATIAMGMSQTAAEASCTGQFGANQFCGTGTSSGIPGPRSDLLIDSGKPWCDPRAKGALFDGATDDTAAWQACVTTLRALGTGGTIRSTAGVSCIKTAGGVQIDNSGPKVSIEGAGMQQTYMDACGADVTVLNVNSSKLSVRGLTISGKGAGFAQGGQGSFAAGFTQNPLEVGTLCVDCVFYDVEVWGGKNPINNAGTDSRWYNSYSTWGYGQSNHRIYAPNGNGNAGTRIIDGTYDQLWPNFTIPPAQCVAWIALHAYVAGECAVTGGYTIQYTANGTSGAVAPTLNNYFTNITDGSATASLAYPVGFALLNLDSNASEVLATKIDLSGASDYGLALTNTLGGNGPFYNHFDTIIVSAQNKHGVFLSAGHHIVIQNSHLLVCIDQTLAAACGAITWTSANWLGDSLINNNFISGAYIGATVSGSNNVRTYLNNNTITTTTNGVSIFPGVSNWSVKGGSAAGTTAGVVVQAGASDYYEIDTDVGTSGISDSGSGTHKIIIDRSTNTIASNYTTNGVLYGDSAGAIRATAQGGTNTVLAANAGTPSFTTSPTIGSLTITGNATSVTFPTTTLLGIVNANGSNTSLSMDAYGAVQPQIIMRRAANTAASPSAISSGNFIFSLGGRGYGTSFGTVNDGAFGISAAENFDGTHHGTNANIFLTPTASVTVREVSRFYASGGFTIGTTAISTDPGAGGILADGTIKTQSTTDATSTSTGAMQNTGGMSVNKRVFMNGLSADTASTDNSVCHDTTSHEIKTGTGAAGICLGTSSARYKRDIISAHVGLDEVLRLRPVNFYYLPGRGGPQLQYGFLAEDVVDVIPSIVGLDRNAEPNTVDMMAMVPILVKSIQELKSEVDSLSAGIKFGNGRRGARASLGATRP